MIFKYLQSHIIYRIFAILFLSAVLKNYFSSYKKSPDSFINKTLLIHALFFLIFVPFGDLIFYYLFGIKVTWDFFSKLHFISIPLCFSVANIFESFPFNKNRSVLSRAIEAFLLLISGAFSFKYSFLIYLLWFWFLIYAVQAFYFKPKQEA